MAEEAEQADGGKQQARAEKVEVPTYPRERLIAEGEALFGQPRHVVEGALTLAKPANKAHFTRDEMGKLVSQFLDREVEMETSTAGEA